MKDTKRRSILFFALFGAIGFSASVGLSWWTPGIPEWLGLGISGMTGGAALGLALKKWTSALVLALAGFFGWIIASLLHFTVQMVSDDAFDLLTGGAAQFFEIVYTLYSLVSGFLVGAIVGASFAIALRDWKGVKLLTLAGAIGFGIPALILRLGNLYLSLPSLVVLVIWRFMLGGLLGATLGYLEKRKTDVIRAIIQH